jgi:CubicO group peptidase (beta-lactamase class C family)
MTEIQGICEPQFDKVREAFATNFAVHGDVGASVCVYVDGRPVVDLWGGHADKARTKVWERDTIANVYSSTKGVSALSVAMLVDRGVLDYEEPVATYWPEFAAAGKETLPLRFVMTHTSGLPGLRQQGLPVSLFWDEPRMVEMLAAEEPWWEPGTESGYHAMTYGYLVGEIVRRATGESLGTFFRKAIAEPLGADFQMGFGPDQDARIAPLINPDPLPEGMVNPMLEALKDPSTRTYKVLTNPPVPADYEICNRREWRAAEIPAANGHGNARALARVYAAIAGGGQVDGVRLLSAEAVKQATTTQFDGVDTVVPIPVKWGMGFMLDVIEPLRPGIHTASHGGAGGSLGLADLGNNIAFAYVMNQMSDAGPDPRTFGMLEALYSAL